MKRVFLTFVMAAMLTASLAACTTTPSDTNHATGNGNGSVMEGGSANSRARGGMGGDMGGATGSSGTGGSTMRNNGRYYADDNGDVSGRDDSLGNDIRRATDDMMNGVGNAVDDMTR